MTVQEFKESFLEGGEEKKSDLNKNICHLLVEKEQQQTHCT